MSGASKKKKVKKAEFGPSSGVPSLLYHPTHILDKAYELETRLRREGQEIRFYQELSRLRLAALIANDKETAEKLIEPFAEVTEEHDDIAQLIHRPDELDIHKSKHRNWDHYKKTAKTFEQASGYPVTAGLAKALDTLLVPVHAAEVFEEDPNKFFNETLRLAQRKGLLERSFYDNSSITTAIHPFDLLQMGLDFSLGHYQVIFSNCGIPLLPKTAQDEAEEIYIGLLRHIKPARRKKKRSTSIAKPNETIKRLDEMGEIFAFNDKNPGSSVRGLEGKNGKYMPEVENPDATIRAVERLYKGRRVIDSIKEDAERRKDNGKDYKETE